MKGEHWICIVSILIIASMGGLSALQTTISQQQDRIAELKNYIAEKQAIEDQQLVLSAPLEEYRITSSCGIRTDPMGGGEEGLHKGTDLVGPIGAPVLAAAGGIVADHWPAPDHYWRGHPVFGGMVVIDHGEGIFTLYGHMSETFVHRGDVTQTGQVIGRQGSTGISIGDHLHFEVIVDPEAALQGILPRTSREW